MLFDCDIFRGMPLPRLDLNKNVPLSAVSSKLDARFL